MNENEIYSTKDFYLAAFLKAKDLKLLKTVKSIKKNEFYFCFLENKATSEIINNFYSGTGKVSAAKFVNAIRDLKALIYNLKN